MDAGTRLRVGAQDVGRYGRTVFLAAVAMAGWSLSSGLTGQALPRMAMLATLKDGLWELRQRGSTTVDRVCTRDGLGLIKTWAAPTSNEVVPVTFGQHIGANDALRTGSYSKTLTFTLSTTTP